jgi:hypothetical protein
MTFVRALERGQPPDWRSAFSAFVLSVQPLQRTAPQPHVFVSRREKAAPVAEQICLAGHRGEVSRVFRTLILG